MAPKKSSGKSTAAAATASPRKTRSATAGKRVEPPPAAPAKPPAKKARVAKEKKAEDVAPAPAAADVTSVAIIIEACKQCNRFKTRANTVKEGLESAIPGIEVTINPEKDNGLLKKTSIVIKMEVRNLGDKFCWNPVETKTKLPKSDCDHRVPAETVILAVTGADEPRRGCFEVRKASGEIFISLLDLKRPFTKLTDLDMDQVVKDIIEKIK